MWWTTLSIARLPYLAISYPRLRPYAAMVLVWLDCCVHWRAFDGWGCVSTGPSGAVDAATAVPYLRLPLWHWAPPPPLVTGCSFPSLLLILGSQGARSRCCLPKLHNPSLPTSVGNDNLAITTCFCIALLWRYNALPSQCFGVIKQRVMPRQRAFSTATQTAFSNIALIGCMPMHVQLYAEVTGVLCLR